METNVLYFNALHCFVSHRIASHRIVYSKSAIRKKQRKKASEQAHNKAQQSTTQHNTTQRSTTKHNTSHRITPHHKTTRKMIVGTSTSRMALPLLLPLLPLLPLLLPTRVDAVWYSEVCPTHMRYKVRVDPDTGGVVQVTHPGAFVHKQTRPQPSREGTVHWEGNSHSNSNGNASNEPAPPPPPPPQDPNNNGRTLRSNRVWRDPGDSETDALVVGGAYDNKYEYERSSSSFSFARRVLETFRRIDIGVDIDTEWLLPRSLLGDENPHDFGVLQEGEFFVKPCLCESTRWTFPQPEEGNNETNGNNETIDDLRSDPGNWGQYPNGLYAYVPPGAASKRDEWDDLPLYLCNERAVYCGVPANSDDGSSTNAAYEHNHNGNHNAVKCYDQNMRHVIARNAWPLILLWYFGLAVICCCTVHGRTAGDYVWDRATHWFQKVLCFGGGTSGGSGTSSGGGDAGTSGGNTHTAGDANEPTASTQRAHYDFNDRMLRRMIDDNDGEWGRRRTQPQDTNTNNNTNARGRPWFYSSQRRLFERSLLAQVQWIWRHQEYLRELERREMGLPPPQIKLRVKRFNSETTPSKNGDGGGYGVGTGQPGQRGGCGVAANAGASDGAANSDSDSNSDSNSNSNSNSNTANANANATTTTTTEESVGTSTANSVAAADGTTDSNDADADAATTRIPSATLPNDCGANEKGDDSDNNGNDNDDDEPEYVTLPLGPDLDENDTGDDENDNDNGLAQPAANEHEHEHEQHGDDDTDAPTCTICFCPFEDGDRIGDLPCRHEFHVECLKGWLQRKNACPLCNARLGRPERPEPAAVHNDNGNGNDGNNDDDDDPDTSHHSIGGLVRRIRIRRNGRRRSRSPSAEFGEIRRGNRVGMIGSIGAAEDIAVASQTTAGTNRGSRVGTIGYPRV